jgi:hypothetical protein
VIKVNRFSKVETTFGGFGGGLGRLEEPTRIEVGPNDVVYVLDRSGIVLFDAFGNFLNRFGTEVIGTPVALFADDRGLLAGDPKGLSWFDENNRPRARFAWSGIVSDSSHVRSFAAAAGTLVVLTVSGIVRVPDPRTAELDKPPKSP